MILTLHSDWTVARSSTLFWQPPHCHCETCVLQCCCSLSSPVRQNVFLIFRKPWNKLQFFTLHTLSAPLHKKNHGHIIKYFMVKIKFFMFLLLIKPHFVIYNKTYLPIVLNVDGAVIHFYQKEVLCIWSEQQREWRVSIDILGKEQWARAWEFIQVTIKRHYKLICHQQSLVCLDERQR